jgi:hypothetical protein
MPTRSSEDGHLRSRVVVCRSLLGATACDPQNAFDPQAHHLHMDGQTERVNQIVQDMLRACVMEH